MVGIVSRLLAASPCGTFAGLEAQPAEASRHSPSQKGQEPCWRMERASDLDPGDRARAETNRSPEEEMRGHKLSYEADELFQEDVRPVARALL